jgi:hypothetical protein
MTTEPVILDLMRLFGWQGGTIHQVTAHVRHLRDFHEAWVEVEVAGATGNPDLLRAKRQALIAAHRLVRESQ